MTYHSWHHHSGPTVADWQDDIAQLRERTAAISAALDDLELWPALRIGGNLRHTRSGDLIHAHAAMIRQAVRNIEDVLTNAEADGPWKARER